MGFTKFAIDQFISNKISAVTECGAKDVSQEFSTSKSWLSSFHLVNIFQNHIPEENRPFAFQFVRNVESAFRNYALATNYLKKHIENGQGSWSTYYQALDYLEQSVSSLYKAFECSRKKLETDFFKKHDGSKLDKLNKIYNISKHEIAEKDQVIWITNKGIHSDKVSLSFEEFEELLRSYGGITDKITNQYS